MIRTVTMSAEDYRAAQKRSERDVLDVASPSRVLTGIQAQGRLQPVSLKTFAAFVGELKPVSYAVRPFVRSSCLLTVTAKTGVGKTAWLVNVALAAATGGERLLGDGTKVKKGRVVYFSAENPDDLRMRMIVAARHYGIDPAAVGDYLPIIDSRSSPEDIKVALERAGEIALVVVDTLQAGFDGVNLNDNVEAGEYIRRCRLLTQLPGSPSVLIAAHPKKEIGDEALVPYGAGAILNEIDGNLTLTRSASGLVTLHWAGKFRGLDFEPVAYRFEMATAEEVVDDEGNPVPMPVLIPATAGEEERREQGAANRDRAVLQALVSHPGVPLRQLAIEASINVNALRRALKALERAKLAEQKLGKWTITPKGKKALLE